MKTRIPHFFVALLLLMVGFSTRAATLTVFAAASLTDSLKKIAVAYEQQSADKLVFNFEASSTLARQIEAGSPANIFFSADEAKMDGLAQKNLIVVATRKSLLSNSLVIVVPADSHLNIHSAADLAAPSVKHLALADPKGVPAGVYAKAYLQKKNLWNAVSAKVVPTENVRAALAAVESGNVEAGIVYKTDSAISKKVKVACEISGDASPAIHYPVAVVRESKNSAAALKFIEYLQTKTARQIFETYGFVTIP